MAFAGRVFLVLVDLCACLNLSVGAALFFLKKMGYMCLVGKHSLSILQLADMCRLRDSV